MQIPNGYEANYTAKDHQRKHIENKEMHKTN